MTQREDIDLDRVREITRRVASRPLRDARSPKEILDDAWATSCPAASDYSPDRDPETA
jgi:hypothetical protein